LASKDSEPPSIWWKSRDIGPNLAQLTRAGR
jgi:hypothetical protein